MQLTQLAAAPTVSHRALVWTFVATTFAASTLLFLVQPMFAKMVLPRFGGSAAVWNTCVLFFQTTLLLGYLYAHVTVRWLGARRQSILNILVMAAAGGLLPLGVSSTAPEPNSSPVWWLLETLALRLGLPFFALSTMAPLVQRWYATLPVPSAANPYFLYAASNTGSILALLAYPFVLEPLWGTRTQTLAWAAGYGVLLVLVAVCSWLLQRYARELPPAVAVSGVSWTQKARWTALAFLPSSLMLGVTTHISTDLASIPLLWVLPLAAYLLTFVLAFSERDRVPRTLVARSLPVLVLVSLFSVAFQLQATSLIPLHLAAFFVTALACHDALARARPPAQDLTTFYVWMSLGGMLGGVFNTLVAPLIFTGIFEYPLVLALACLVRPSPHYRHGRIEPWGLFVATGVVPPLVCAAVWVAGKAPPGVSLPAAVLIGAMVPAALSAVANRRAPFNALAALSVVALMAAGTTRTAYGDVIFAGRSFFGVSRVVEATDHSYRLLQHGTTLHGRQNLPAGTACEPKSYYDAEGPAGDLFRRSGRPFKDVALAGLGSGGLACYAEPGSRWTFFEIDPLVERIARDPSLFTFLRNSPGRVEIAIGDGRKRIESAARASYDLIVLDAFSSDSVPVHLLTREAIDAYVVRLRAGGVIALHISNRHLDLESVIANLVKEEHLRALANEALDISAADAVRGRAPAHWVALAIDDEPLEVLRGMRGWRPLHERPGVHAWTDDYSNLLRSIKWR
jgi:hypothetical protein